MNRSRRKNCIRDFAKKFALQGKRRFTWTNQKSKHNESEFISKVQKYSLSLRTRDPLVIVSATLISQRRANDTESISARVLLRMPPRFCKHTSNMNIEPMTQ